MFKKILLAYNGSREGTMQGSGTAGGLGLDAEFFPIPRELVH